MNLRYPLLDFPLQKGVEEVFISNRRSKVLVAACGKVYSVGSKQFLCHLKVLFLGNQPCLTSVGVIAKLGANLVQPLPACQQIVQATASRSIISKPNLVGKVIELTGERYNCESVHRHCEGVSLSGALRGK